MELYLFSKLVCIWFLILYARIQFLKESKVIAMESFSIELKETIVPKCFKKGIFEILDEFMLYFISIIAWVENVHIKNCNKNLMIIMPSYFYKEIKDKTWNSSVKKTILVTSQTYRLRSTLYWCFHWIKVRNRDLSRVRPEWSLKNKNQIWQSKTKIQKLIKNSNSGIKLGGFKFF